MIKCQHCKTDMICIPGTICDDCDRELLIDELEENLTNISLNELLCLYRIHFELTRSTTKSE